MRLFLIIRAICVATLLGLACGPPAAIERALTTPASCQLMPVLVRAPQTVTIGLSDPVQPDYAPWAHNEGERLLFHHLYETLVIVDCLGDVGPGLASKWEPEHGGRRWTFELRDDARFWDGTRVMAGDVVRCWQDAITLHASIDSAVAAGDRRVRIFLSSRQRTVPRELSSGAFAVSKLQPGSRWPLGTGPYRIDGNAADFVSMRPVGGAEPVLGFQRIDREDTKDLLEGTIDMLITTDPGVVEYARARTQFETQPLPWNRTYVLLCVSRVEDLRLGYPVPGVPAEFGARLALDAVRGDARGFESPSWWNELRGCGMRSEAARPRGALTGLRRILYDRSDVMARDLTERIIALAATDPAVSEDAAAITAAIPGLSGDFGSTAAQGVSAADLILRLRDGDEFAYVVPVRRRPHDPCYEAVRLLQDAPWLAAAGVDLDEAIVPLVDARPHVVARRDRFGLVVDWYGDLLIVNGK